MPEIPRKNYGDKELRANLRLLEERWSMSTHDFYLAWLTKDANVLTRVEPMARAKWASYVEELIDGE